MRLRAALLALAGLVLAATAASAQTAFTTSTQAALLLEFRSCVDQGKPAGCLTPEQIRDIIGSAAPGSVATGVSAAGTNQGTATALTAQITSVSTVASGTGVILPTAVDGQRYVQCNLGANALLVYPASGAAIDGGSTNAPVSVAVATCTEQIAMSATAWRTITASLPNVNASPGSYTNANITVDAKGRVTTAANGSSGGGGTVTSVALTAPSRFSVSGSPIGGAGTLAITDNNVAANLFLGGPTSGGAAAPTYKAVTPTGICGGSGGSSSLFLRQDCTWAAPSTAAVTVQPVNTANTYTIQASDAGTVLPFSNASFPVLTFAQAGAGYFPPNSQVTIVNAYTGNAGATASMSVQIINTATTRFAGTPTFTNSGFTFFLEPQQVAIVSRPSDGSDFYYVSISGVSPGADIQSGSTTVQLYDCTQTLFMTNSGPANISVPTGLPAANCKINIIRLGTGQITFPQVATPSGGFSLFSLNGQTHDAGQYAGMTITILNGGTTGVLTGALAP